MNDRADLINYLIDTYKYESYLEIGLDDGANYRKIQCKGKESVDPYLEENHDRWDLRLNGELPYEIAQMLTYRMTSDEFFKQNRKKYDLVFIDGLHTKEQVWKDIMNSIQAISDNGLIVVHDCLPRSYEAQLVPRTQAEWNGDVWRTMVELTRQGLDISVWDKDYGVGIIRKPKDFKEQSIPKFTGCTWEEFSSNRDKYLKIIDTRTLKNIYK